MLHWRRSSFCDHGACIDVANFGDLWYVRDSKNPDGPVLVYTADEWQAIVRQATVGRPACWARLLDGSTAWVGETAAAERTWLEFTEAEVVAFLAGVRAGEFRVPAAVPG